MASESDSGYSVSATPVSSASPAIHHHSREATDSPQGGGLINLDEADLEGDTEAGPDINDDEFKSANEIFKDPSSFDFLSQVHIAAILYFLCYFFAVGGNNSRFKLNNPHNTYIAQPSIISISKQNLKKDLCPVLL